MPMTNFLCLSFKLLVAPISKVPFSALLSPFWTTILVCTVTHILARPIIPKSYSIIMALPCRLLVSSTHLALMVRETVLTKAGN